MIIAGQRTWAEFDDLDVNDADFAAIGEDFENSSRLVSHGNIGDAASRLLPQAPLVDFAKSCMANKVLRRTQLGPDSCL